MNERDAAMEASRDQASLGALVEGIPGAVFRRGAEPPWRFAYVSDGIEAIAGCRPSDLVPPGLLTDVDLAMPEDVPAVAEAIDRAVSTAQPYRVEYRIRHVDGTTRWVEERGSAVRDGSGGPPWIDGVILDVTERSQREQALLEGQARLDALMGSTPDHIYFKDLESRFTLISAATARSFGLDDPSQAVGKADLDFFTEEHARPALEDEREIMRTGLPMVDREERETRRDGRETWASTTKLPRFDGQGNIVGTFGVSRDITERKQAEAALRDSEIRLRAITDSAQDAIVMMDPKGLVGYWNPAAERVFGYTSAEAIGQDLHALFVPARYGDVFRSAFPEFQQTGHGPAVGRTLDMEARRRDGREFPIQLSLSAVHIHGGWHAVGVVRDATETKRAQEDLLRERSLLEALMDSTPDHIYFKDVESRFTLISAAMARSFGLHDPSEAVGKTDFDFFSAEEARLALEDEREIMRTGRPVVDLEERETWPDGRETWASTTKLPRVDSQGNVVGTFGISRDITERRRVDEELRETNRRLEASMALSAEMTLRAEQANIAKSEFLANMSHEIRTPHERRDRHDRAAAGHRRSTRTSSATPRPCARAASRCSALINDILDFSKIEAGKLELETLDFDLRALLDDLADHAGAARPREGAGVHLRAPHPDVPALLAGDPGRLRQMLVNLVGNAVKFTDEGEVSVRVSLVRETDAEVALRFAVKDTGIGIPADKQGHPVRQVHPGRRLDHAAVRRHRAGAGDLQAAGRADGRRDRARERRRTRLGVLVHRPVRKAGRGRTPRDARRPRSAEPASWSSTTTPPTARS